MLQVANAVVTHSQTILKNFINFIFFQFPVFILSEFQKSMPDIFIPWEGDNIPLEDVVYSVDGGDLCIFLESLLLLLLVLCVHIVHSPHSFGPLRSPKQMDTLHILTPYAPNAGSGTSVGLLLQLSRLRPWLEQVVLMRKKLMLCITPRLSKTNCLGFGTTLKCCFGCTYKLHKLDTPRPYLA